ncbi:MAG TPA: hypothetical protein DCS05_06490, partial [Nitrospiraceae bacterium]|nr:hypothetical protein [Nitrospiraceae bacterium]
MDLAKAVAVTLVLIGAAFIFASFSPARASRPLVPNELRRKWRVILYLMYFFFAGYLFFDTVLLLNFHLPFTEF